MYFVCTVLFVIILIFGMRQILVNFTRNNDYCCQTTLFTCHVMPMTGATPMTSTADVVIHVGDRNDNPPTFVRHPLSPMNTTYLVSTRARRGYVITRLRTSDADSGINARVTFQLADVTARDGGDASASGSGLFHVDRDLGIVSVAGSLSDSDGTTYELIVVAMDGGEPPMSSFATVSIAVNSSVVDAPTSTGAADRRRSVVVRQNLLVVVALAVISGLITVCLVVAIVCIRRGDRRRRKPATGHGLFILMCDSRYKLCLMGFRFCHSVAICHRYVR